MSKNSNRIKVPGPLPAAIGLAAEFPRQNAKQEEQSAEQKKVRTGAARLLKALQPDGAFAAGSALDQDGLLDVFHVRKGVSLRVAGSTSAAADSLIAHDLCIWSSPNKSGRRYLTLSSTGRAHLRRHEARADGHPFIAQHKDVETATIAVDEVLAEVTRDTAESPLAWLARRKGTDGLPLINAAQLEAGERLRRDIEQSQILPRITANWSASVATSSRGETAQHITDMTIGARQRVNQAVAAVGSDCAGLLIDVCGFLKTLKIIEFERGWPQRSAKVALGIALSLLADHYGLRSYARGPDRFGQLRHWGSGDYRPAISESEHER